MNERIRILRKSLDMTQEEFSSKIGLSRNFIAQIETGAKIPSDRTIKDICREFNINEDWLRYGTEPMKVPHADKLTTYLAQISMGNDDFIKDLIEVYMELDQTSKDALKEIANKMAEKQNDRG